MKMRFIIKTIPVTIAMVADREGKARANPGLRRDRVVNAFWSGARIVN
jgi:hypothetical protein